ncbi:MAG: hypothetical protein F6K24_30150 [Okeania sp. SIO2D1]|nr:hypothetical protein [Okeania sp. SIO2C9]NEQ75133.1 hypothetical protein [Okeania sp. SIO2C9]NES69188.1 hypothetical protein [Okeania sp. SIO2D1]
MINWFVSDRSISLFIKVSMGEIFLVLHRMIFFLMLAIAFESLYSTYF